MPIVLQQVRAFRKLLPFRVLLHRHRPGRQTVPMATVITVQADTREECAATLDHLCEAHGYALRLPPMRSAGTDRWIARATKAPDREVEGLSAP